MSKLSNFDFLKDFDMTLYKLGNRIEKEVKISPSAVKADATPFLQHILEKLLNKIGFKFNSRKDFYSQLDKVYRNGLISYRFKNQIYSAYLLRNKIHDNLDEIEKNEVYVALSIHEKLFNIAKKYYRDFNEKCDDFTRLPSYQPIELDTTDDEIELVKIPDFSEIIEFKYDYCVICGEPNHSNYSLCCPKCSRVLDNANNFISIRNYFGKDATFTKEDLIEYGMHEGYINQLITNLTRENILKVTGRFITFNNMYFDKYMDKIDDYLSVGELITKFREDKITPLDIKQTHEYKEGSLGNDPFKQFYKIINHEIINKFERDILATENLWDSIDYTTITEKQLETWYLKNLGHYKRGTINESFVVFNDLLMSEYIDLKREGLFEKDIKAKLNVSPRIYDFWIDTHESFEDELTEIKKDLVLKALGEGKTKAEAIEIAGVTPHEYENLYKLSNYYHDEYADEINREIEARKLRFVSYLGSTSLKTACKFAKITVVDFYEWYDDSKLNSPFYIDSTKILMNKYLDERRKGKSKQECLKAIDLKEKYLNQWLTRNLGIYKEFRKTNMDVTVDLILRGFKWNKTKVEISKIFDVDIKKINRSLSLGEREYGSYRVLFEFYENEVIPNKLEKFLEVNSNKSIRKSLENADLTEEEIDKYYELGKSGDERFADFYKEFLSIKKGLYVSNVEKGKSHKIAMKESHLSDEEYEECRDDLEYLLRSIRFKIVLETIENKKTSNVAASKAGCTVDDIYEWYFKGRDGDEDYEKFYELFHKAYVKPSIVPIQEKLDNKNTSLDNLIRSNKHLFTKKDFEIWLKHGLINVDVFYLDSDDDSEEDDEEESKKNKNEVKEISLGKFNRMTNNRTTLGRINKKDYDVEELKKQILKK